MIHDPILCRMPAGLIFCMSLCASLINHEVVHFFARVWPAATCSFEFFDCNLKMSRSCGASLCFDDDNNAVLKSSPWKKVPSTGLASPFINTVEVA